MRISIITPTSNSIQYLNEYLQGFEGVNNLTIELIFIDNCSTDGTIQRILDFISKSKFEVVILSSKDSGPAQAINHGFKMAKYEIVGWLNSDDVYSKGAIHRALKKFSINSKLKFIYGNAIHIDGAGTKLNKYPTHNLPRNLRHFKTGNFICQPTIFFRKEVLQDVGYLNEYYSASFDFEWFIRIFKKYSKSSFGFIDNIQAYSRLHSQCITWKMREKVAVESMRAIYDHFGEAPCHWVLTYVEELYIKYPYVNFSESLAEHIKKLLLNIKPITNTNEFNNLIKLLNSDRRLGFSNQDLFVSVYSDGWAGQKLLIKLRHQSQYNNKKIVLNFSANWPSSRKINKKAKIYLKIRTPEGDISTISLSQDDEVILNLEIPEVSNLNFSTWLIETRQFFVPSNLLPGSKDDRRLSFLVNKILIK